MNDTKTANVHWSPSIANALQTRAALVQLITDGDAQAGVIGDLQNALTSIAKARNDESMMALCEVLRLEIGNLWGILIEADASAKTEIIVRENPEW
jgi:hypothetical protein